MPSKSSSPATSYEYLTRHLNDRKNEEDRKVLTAAFEKQERIKEKKGYLLYIIPETLTTSLNIENSEINKIISSLEDRLIKKPSSVIIILDNWNEKTPIPEKIQKIGYVHFRRKDNYY